MMTMISTIPEEVYDAVPSLPCLQPYLLPVKEHGLLLPRHYVFVLQEDDRTLPPTPENVELVREALGLGKNVQPVWVPIYRCVEHESLGGAIARSFVGPIQGDVLIDRGRGHDVHELDVDVLNDAKGY